MTQRSQMYIVIVIAGATIMQGSGRGAILTKDVYHMHQLLD